MRYLCAFLALLTLSCNEIKVNQEEVLKPIASVEIDFLHTDSTSIRAIEVHKNEVVYAGSNGHYGYLSGDIGHKEINKGTIDFLGRKPAFRSVANTTEAFYMLSIESPALLYRYDKNSNEVKLVYTDDNEKAFYDAMAFWNDREGIALGDPIDDCLSILITRDGGNNWGKLDCSSLPMVTNGEAAFAASNTNIKIVGEHTWIITGGTRSRVFYSDDKGYSWTVYNTPIIQGAPTQGAYSIDFYDDARGIIYGGDYTQPDENKSNIAITNDGGKSWQLIAQGSNQGYKSCVQYVPNSNGREIVATGFTGISYSQNGGASWTSISDGDFLSLRFVNDSIAYAGGKNVLARLTFKRSF